MPPTRHPSSRVHIHVQSAEGEAKFWLEPKIELARNHGLTDQALRRIEKIITERQEEVRDAWDRHSTRGDARFAPTDHSESTSAATVSRMPSTRSR